MKIVFYSNCQSRGIRWFLKHSACNELKITSCILIDNYLLIKHKRKIPSNVLKEADVFIYQPIQKKHGIYSTDLDVKNNVLSHLPKHCKQISFPYIYNSALWPIIKPCDIDGFAGELPGRGEYINKKPIHKLIDEGNTIDMILQLFDNKKIDFEYKQRFLNCMDILRKKETICDIKIADYIQNNIHSRKLFITQNHPTTCIFVHCSNQILNLLKCKVQFDYNTYAENIINLPGKCMHSSYDLDYWNFAYNVDTIDDAVYRDHIKNICNNYILKI